MFYIPNKVRTNTRILAYNHLIKKKTVRWNGEENTLQNNQYDCDQEWKRNEHLLHISKQEIPGDYNKKHIKVLRR